MKDETPSEPVARAEALAAAGDYAAAIALLEEHLRSGKGGLLTRFALGRAFLSAGRTARALAIAREAVALSPSLPAALLLLGDCLLAAGHLPAAIAEFQRALDCDPKGEPARLALGKAWLEAGEAARAAGFLAPLARSKSAPEARRLLAEAKAMRRAPRAPAAYVRHLFDQFSTDYDRRMLEHLSYRAPSILRELASLVMGPFAGKLSILDLGCGTGLAGSAFADIAGSLTGIDLSPRMLDAARTRGIYSVLVEADIEAALDSEGPRYDLILAADTLVYLGDLGRVFRGAAQRLDARGFFLFTLEKKPGRCYALGPKRRYRHSENYVWREAARAGLEVMAVLACEPRSEAGSPVEGLAVALAPI
jgi:predicted TPR repeat methyltransferase